MLSGSQIFQEQYLSDRAAQNYRSIPPLAPNTTSATYLLKLSYANLEATEQARNETLLVQTAVENAVASIDIPSLSARP